MARAQRGRPGRLRGLRRHRRPTATAQADGRLVATTAVPVADAPIERRLGGRAAPRARPGDHLPLRVDVLDAAGRRPPPARPQPGGARRGRPHQGRHAPTTCSSTAPGRCSSTSGRSSASCPASRGPATASSASCSSTRSTCRPSPTSRSSRGSAARCNGISPTIAAHALGGRKRFRRDLFTHVRLHARAEARYADADAEPRRAGRAEARRLRAEDHRRPDGQPPARPSSASSGRRRRPPGRPTATGATTPTPTSRPRRRSWPAPPPRSTRRWCSTSAPTTAASRAWPSRPARRSPIAVDGDHLVVDHLYRQLRAEGEHADPPARARPGRSVARPRLAVAGAAVVRRPGAARPRAVPRRHPPPRAVEHGALRRDRRLPPRLRGAARGRDAPPRRPDGGPPPRPQARPGCSTTTTARSGRRRCGSASTCDEQVTLPSGTRTLYRCRPR